jgi:hypothetical protein
VVRDDAVKKIDWPDILRLAAETGLDPRTIERAVDNGIDALRAKVDRERLKAAADKLRLKL